MMKKTMNWLQRHTDHLAAVLSVLLALLTISAFTGQWPWNSNPYRSYTLQACAWLNGQLDLGKDYPWLELAIYEGKYYVSFPPFPSYVLLPFAAFLGEQTPDGWIALCCTLLGVWFAVKLAEETGGKKHALMWVLFLFLGTGYPFIAMNGYVWFIAQNMCFTLSVMSLYFACRGRGGWALGCWACAVGCRPMVLLFFPVLALILWQRWHREHQERNLLHMIADKWYWAIPPAVIGGSYMALNWARFGSITEFGHNYLPEFTRISTGQFHISYLSENMSRLLRLPRWDGEVLQFFSADGNAFWLVIPLFIPMAAAWIYALATRKSPLALRVGFPVLVAGYVLILCLHRTLGGWQWGTRYMLDVLPWCFYALLLQKPAHEAFDRLAVPFVIYGTVISCLGTVMTYLG